MRNATTEPARYLVFEFHVPPPLAGHPRPSARRSVLVVTDRLFLPDRTGGRESSVHDLACLPQKGRTSRRRAGTQHVRRRTDHGTRTGAEAPRTAFCAIRLRAGSLPGPSLPVASAVSRDTHGRRPQPDESPTRARSIRSHDHQCALAAPGTRRHGFAGRSLHRLHQGRGRTGWHEFRFVSAPCRGRGQLGVLRAGGGTANRPARAAANITWHRRVLDMRPIYKQTRLLLVPSQWKETWGRVVVEAQFSGIPAIASDVGGLAQNVSDTGRLLDAGAPAEAWAEAVRSIWFDDAAYARAAERAYRRAESYWKGAASGALRLLELPTGQRSRWVQSTSP